MASFTINFEANYPGQHRVGYRTYNTPLNFYNTVDVNVTAPGDQSVTINIPGNLYCASDGILYECYLVAWCQNPNYLDDNLDGIPNAAETFDVQLTEQVDPSQIVTIECTATPIGVVSIVANGISLCTNGTYSVTVTPVAPADEIEQAVLTVTVTGNVIASYNIVNPGAYTVAPVLTVTVPNCSGAVTLKALFSPLVLNLETLTYDQITLHDSLTNTLSLYIGDIVDIAPDETALIALEATGQVDVSVAINTHCQTCQAAAVTNTATTGEGILIYQTCWDQGNTGLSINLHKRKLLPGVNISLGCVIPETVNVIQGSLNVLPSITYTECV